MYQATYQLIQDLVDGWNEHNPNKVAALYAPDFEEDDIAAAGKHYGQNAARGSLLVYLRAFPDLTLTAEQIVAQDGCVALAWVLTGTHRGRFMNIPATGRPVRVRGVSLMTIVDGRIQRTNRVWDLAGLLRALGLLPELS